METVLDRINNCKSVLSLLALGLVPKFSSLGEVLSRLSGLPVALCLAAEHGNYARFPCTAVLPGLDDSSLYPWPLLAFKTLSNLFPLQFSQS